MRSIVSISKSRNQLKGIEEAVEISLYTVGTLNSRFGCHHIRCVYSGPHYYYRYIILYFLFLLQRYGWVAMYLLCFGRMWAGTMARRSSRKTWTRHSDSSLRMPGPLESFSLFLSSALRLLNNRIDRKNPNEWPLPPFFFHLELLLLATTRTGHG